MPRRLRFSTGELAYHVVNRRVAGYDYSRILPTILPLGKILREAYHQTSVRIAAYLFDAESSASFHVAGKQRQANESESDDLQTSAAARSIVR
jgi:hypothetical protein